jgi:enoyl-CoA hydratase
MEYEWVELSVEDNVGTLTFSRVEGMNALSLSFATEITEAVRELEAMEEVRVIVLNSSAKAFMVGLDLKDFVTLGLDGSAKSNLEFPAQLHYLFDSGNSFEECRKPIIAAVHGMCIGGGLDIISACDIRLCTEDTTFSLREAALGIVADMGVLQRLPYIIGQGFTREMAYTARFFTAREVERMGLVSTIYSDYDAMMEGATTLALQIAANPPLAVQSTKDVLNYSRSSTVPNGMLYAMHKNMVLFTSEDLREALSSFMEKRKPDFKGR